MSEYTNSTEDLDAEAIHKLLSTKGPKRPTSWTSPADDELTPLQIRTVGLDVEYMPLAGYTIEVFNQVAADLLKEIEYWKDLNRCGRSREAEMAIAALEEWKRLIQALSLQKTLGYA